MIEELIADLERVGFSVTVEPMLVGSLLRIGDSIELTETQFVGVAQDILADVESGLTQEEGS